MMMECPRCGFTQPKDRYCANCGLDVEHYVAKPKPVWMRVVQNPNLHLTLIGALILVVVGYIFYSQRELVSREVGNLFKGSLLLSRDAGDPDAPPARPLLNEAPEETPPEPAPPTEAAVAATTVAPTPAPEKAAEMPKLEQSSWELPRETLAALVANAEKVGEGSGGRAYLWTQGAKVAETVAANGRRLTPVRTLPVQPGIQTIAETPAGANDPFQFGFYMQVTKGESKDLSVKWDSSLVTPTKDAVAEVTLSGNVALPAAAAMLIVFDPPNRSLREDVLVKSGEGPWSVLASPDFATGVTDWIVLLHFH
jgi:hypothetical protein